jgi:hypothetical protein
MGITVAFVIWQCRRGFDYFFETLIKKLENGYLIIDGL